MRDMADQVVARCVEHITSLPNQPLYGVHGAEALCERMRESSPASGTPLPALLDDLFTTYIPQSFNTPSPGYLAYIPGGGLFPAALADFIADTTNRYTGIWQAAPALVQLEANALDWLREWMGFRLARGACSPPAVRWRRSMPCCVRVSSIWASTSDAVCCTRRIRCTIA